MIFKSDLSTRVVQWSWCRGNRRDAEIWVVGSAPAYLWDACHHSCPDDYLAQFSLTNMHKGGIKHHHLHLNSWGQEQIHDVDKGGVHGFDMGGVQDFD